MDGMNYGMNYGSLYRPKLQCIQQGCYLVPLYKCLFFFFTSSNAEITSNNIYSYSCYTRLLSISLVRPMTGILVKPQVEIIRNFRSTGLQYSNLIPMNQKQLEEPL